MTKCYTCNRNLKQDGIKNTTKQCRLCHIEEAIDNLELELKAIKQKVEK